MTNMTLSIPKEVYGIVKQHNEIRWSEIARRAIVNEAEKLNLIDKIASKSKLTMKDVLEINKKVKKGLLEKYL